MTTPKPLKKIMVNLVCLFLHHKLHTHLDYIYGTLAREHIQCTRCEKTVFFDRCPEKRDDELLAIGDVRDGAVSGCNPL